MSDVIGHKPQYWVKVLSITGAVVSPNLQVANVEFTWGIYTQGQKQLGDFKLTLYDVRDLKWKWLLATYNLLNYEQRIEVYDNPDMLGDPVFTGVITKLPQDLQRWEVQGQSVLRRLEERRLRRYQVFNSTAPNGTNWQLSVSQILSQLVSTYQVIVKDDFNVADTLPGTIDSTFSITASTNGANAQIINQQVFIVAPNPPGGTGGSVTLTSATTFSSAFFDDCKVSLEFQHSAAPAGSSQTLPDLNVNLGVYTFAYRPCNADAGTLPSDGEVAILKSGSLVTSRKVTRFDGVWNHLDAFTTRIGTNRQLVCTLNNVEMINIVDTSGAAFSSTIGLQAQQIAMTGLNNATVLLDNFVAFQHTPQLTVGTVGLQTQTFVTGPLPGQTFADNAAVGTVAWSNPGNAATLNSTYATAALNNQTSHQLVVTNPAPAIPTGATITKIQVDIYRNQTAAQSMTDNGVTLWVGGASYGPNLADPVTNWPTTSGWANYTWTAANTTMPTATQVNASNFGMQISAINATAASTARVDVVQFTISYTYTQAAPSDLQFNGDTQLDALDKLVDLLSLEYIIAPKQGAGNDILSIGTAIGHDWSANLRYSDSPNPPSSGIPSGQLLISKLTRDRSNNVLATILNTYGQVQDDTSANFIAMNLAQMDTFGPIDMDYQDPRVVDTNTARTLAQWRLQQVAFGSVSLSGEILSEEYITNNNPKYFLPGDYIWLTSEYLNIDKKVRIVQIKRAGGTKVITVTLDYLPFQLDSQYFGMLKELAREQRAWDNRMNAQTFLCAFTGTGTLTFYPYIRGNPIRVWIRVSSPTAATTVSVSIDGNNITSGPQTPPYTLQDRTYLTQPGEHTMAIGSSLVGATTFTVLIWTQGIA